MLAENVEEVPFHNEDEIEKGKIMSRESSPSLACDSVSQPKEKQRSIGRWYIGDTLGKGGYSWVKKGYDKKTGKSVALKFMAKAEKTWTEEQNKQVVTEIESLKLIHHPNIMKLYAYNLNSKYPTKTKEKIDCILLVLEYAPGGELFDILYYTSALEEDIARTYFLQLISALDACHKAGIAHRDIKPQNLLLDSRFNLKLTDFGLSKVFKSDNENLMKTFYVGTRGYQAPELLLNQPYDLSCDIFSAGVVLFILLAGYPPFEQAQKKDRWFSALVAEEYEKFWKLHTGCSISNNEKVKDLIQKMLCNDPKKRIKISEIVKHPWCQQKTLEGKELINALRNRYRKMEMKRQQDAKKFNELQQSIPRRNIDFSQFSSLPPVLSKNQVQEGIFDLYTTAHWQDVFNNLHDLIGKIGGHVIVDPKHFKLIATVKAQNSNNTSIVKFEIRCWRSRIYCDPIYNKQGGEHGGSVLVFRLKRLEGDSFNYKMITTNLIQQRCGGIFTGPPRSEQNPMSNLDENVDQEMVDDYDQILAEYGIE